MDFEFAFVADTEHLPLQEAKKIAAEKTIQKKLPGARFRHRNGEAKVINLNVHKGVRADDRRIHSVALPKSNVFLLNS